MIAALGAVVCGCTKRDLVEPQGGKAKLRLTAVSSDEWAVTPVKAAVDVPLLKDTELGLFVADKGAGLPGGLVNSYGNLLYKVGDQGTTGPEVVVEVKKDYDVFAYVPHKTVEATAVSVPVAHGEDVMWTKQSTGEIASNSVTVPLKFAHKCAQIKFLVARGDGDWTGAPDISQAVLTVTGFCESGTLDLQSGTLTPDAGRTATLDNARKGRPVCFIPLGEGQPLALNIRVEYNGKTYVKNYEQVFLPACSYQITAKVGGVKQDEVETIYLSARLTDWVPVEAGGFDLTDGDMI